MESPTNSLFSRQFAAMLQRQFDEEDANDRMAAMLQRQFDEEDAKDRMAAMLQRQFDEEDAKDGLAAMLQRQFDEEAGEQLAAMMQRQFDEEDHLLAAERAAEEQQRVFDCKICMDTLPEESIARIEPCGHSFCKECIRGLIVSQIESRRFPVLCPTCTAEPDNNRPESIGSYVSVIHDFRHAG